jgi:hypothetical protein
LFKYENIINWLYKEACSFIRLLLIFKVSQQAF